MTAKWSIPTLSCVLGGRDDDRGQCRGYHGLWERGMMTGRNTEVIICYGRGDMITGRNTDVIMGCGRGGMITGRIPRLSWVVGEGA